jgi:hypothetical protein
MYETADCRDTCLASSQPLHTQRCCLVNCTVILDTVITDSCKHAVPVGSSPASARASHADELLCCVQQPSPALQVALRCSLPGVEPGGLAHSRRKAALREEPGTGCSSERRAGARLSLSQAVLSCASGSLHAALSCKLTGKKHAASKYVTTSALKFRQQDMSNPGRRYHKRQDMPLFLQAPPPSSRVPSPASAAAVASAHPRRGPAA